MTKTCINCAFCSIHAMSFKEVCDLTEEEIPDTSTHTCDSFAESEDAGQ